MRFVSAALYALHVAVTLVAVVHSQEPEDDYIWDTSKYNTSAPVAFGAASMAALAAFAGRFDADLRAENDTTALRFRMRIAWMDENAVAARGCGFLVRTGSDVIGSVDVHFPAYREHRCDNTGFTYLLRTTSATDPAHTYDVRVPLPHRPKWAELRADGFRRTYVETACVALYVQEIEGYRTVCVDRPLLDVCATLTRQSVRGYEDAAGHIPMSKSRTGIQILVLQDFDTMYGGLQNLTRDASDIVSQYNVCNGIDWVRGSSYGTGYCYAERLQVELGEKDSFRMAPSVQMDPDNCVPVS